LIAAQPDSSTQANEPEPILPSEAKPAHDLIVTILKAVERTHGYLSKTLLSQHLSGVESKAVQGLRLQRLPEFGILRSWKKSHASGFLDKTLDVGLLALSELRVGKVTVSISEAGSSCLSGAQQVPASLMKYVQQCQLAAEKSTIPAVAVPPKSLEPVDTAFASLVTKQSDESKASISTPLRRAPEIKPTATPEPAHLPEVAAPNRPVGDHQDDPVRPLDWLPRTDLKDASLGRDVTAPMIEDWRWTVRLVEHGYRLGECALIRGKIPDAILEDLTKALQDGKRFAIEQLFDRRTQIAVKELKSNGIDPANPPSIFQSYPSLWRFIQRWIAIDSGE
jgi:hypothetical protein